VPCVYYIHCYNVYVSPCFFVVVYQWFGVHNWCICWLPDGQLAVGIEGKSGVLLAFGIHPESEKNRPSYSCLSTAHILVMMANFCS